MKNDELIFRSVVVFVVGFIMFITLMVVGSNWAGANNTEKLTACVSAGGSWDGSRGDCILPGADLDD